jgi:hypothetical protein
MPEPHNTRIVELLFVLAHWHGLAKLRMHTDSTLKLLSETTTDLGDRLRVFQEQTCATFPTRELERERAARMRRQGKDTTKTEAAETEGSNLASQKRKSTGSRQPKQLNLRTYKFHALGDYCYTIRRFGTTDSYSTQPVGI